MSAQLEAGREYEHRMTRTILWKLDTHILPPLALLWLSNFLDRSNVGNARIAGLEHDTHLHGNQFNTALAVFYVAYLSVEMPSNWVLKRMGANRWLPLIVCAWGTVTTLNCLVQNFSGLVAIRIFLGFCEGGLLPGMVLYLSTIYKRHELQLRVGIFYASASLSGAFGGLLATAIIKMDGIAGLAGWRWIFLLEGIATVICGIIAAIFLPASISTASFLTEEEKEFALHRFRQDAATTTATAASAVAARSGSGGRSDRDSPVSLNDEKAEDSKIEKVTPSQSQPTTVHYEDEAFEWREVRRGIFDVQTWLTGFAYLAFVVSLYSYSLFLPTIVAGLGYSGSQAQLHTVPPYVPAVVLTVVIAVLSDRLRWRGPFILICLPVAIIGYIVAITAQTDTGRYAAVFLMAAGVYPCGPSILSILPNNSSGHYKRATTTALQLAIANCGGFVATFAYTQDQAPKYVKGHSIVLAFLILAWLLIGANVTYCRWENKARAEGRRQHNIEEYQTLWDSGETRAPIGDRHPDFRFTL
ncbi:MFS general substrate transporter [Dendrothele bispora CBS 962.96]|uniref:MFS general substrate transporter n=1 Tax=Dendrothele bispora (strain CBS 962.96) TaxID=1314807 RepID=A0A4V4HJ13_DENBC|nr:MFS general substrate transporter [Dendrothele bispora CBS 962.96]